MAEAEVGTGRRDHGRFGMVVLAGVALSGLTSVAAARAWFEAAVDYKTVVGVSDTETQADMPLALALSLVMLAAWGVVLVSGAKARRVVLVLATLAGLGVAACAVLAPFTLPDQVRRQLPPGPGDIDVHLTNWYLVACVAVLLAVAVPVLAWRLVPRWPTMSSRYDAPSASRDPGAEPAAEDADTGDGLALWKALDEGRDPTDR